MATIVLGSSCASAPRGPGWRDIGQGTTREQVMSIMGDPDEFYKDSGHDVLVWQTSKYKKCSIRFDAQSNVDAKVCQEDTQAKAADRQRRMAAFSNIWPEKRPATKTHCTVSPGGFNTVQTDCTSD